MATAHISPKAVAQDRARHSSTKADTRTAEPPPHRHPLRTALRGVGVFLDTAWRVVLLGGEGLDGRR